VWLLRRKKYRKRVSKEFIPCKIVQCSFEDNVLINCYWVKYLL